MKLLIADSIDVDAIELLARDWVVTTIDGDLEGYLERESGFDALIVRSRTYVSARIMELGRFRVIAKTGAGLDNIDMDASRRLGIQVLHTPETPSRSVAELVVGLTLCLIRKIHVGDAGIRGGKWPKADCVGHELGSLRFGIVGSGRIAAELCRLLEAFGTEILLWSPRLSDERAQVLGGKRVEFPRLLSTADVLSIHVPRVDETVGLIGRAELSMMQRTSVLINTARGGIVDERALAHALVSGTIAGAALDVFELEPPIEDLFSGLRNILRTPHIGASTHEAQRNAGMRVIEMLAEYAAADR
jgi:D-3-phosphoglycerate dehydrogenase